MKQSAKKLCSLLVVLCLLVGLVPYIIPQIGTAVKCFLGGRREGVSPAPAAATDEGGSCSRIFRQTETFHLHTAFHFSELVSYPEGTAPYYSLEVENPCPEGCAWSTRGFKTF